MKRLVIINGPPASGKSTVLGELKKSLGWKTVTKDEIKEGLLTELGELSVKENRVLSQKSFGILFERLGEVMEGGDDLLVEGNFRGTAHEDIFKKLIRENNYRVLQIFCHAEDSVLVSRYAERVKFMKRHAGHEQSLNIESVRKSGQCDALDISSSLLDFENTEGQQFQFDDVAKWFEEKP